MNEPTMPILSKGRTAAWNTTRSRDYSFRLAREGVCRVSQGGRAAAYSANRRSSNSNKTGHLKLPMSWNTAEATSNQTYMFGCWKSIQKGHSSTSPRSQSVTYKGYSKSIPVTSAATLGIFGVMGMKIFAENFPVSPVGPRGGNLKQTLGWSFTIAFLSRDDILGSDA